MGAQGSPLADGRLIVPPGTVHCAWLQFVLSSYVWVARVELAAHLAHSVHFSTEAVQQ